MDDQPNASPQPEINSSHLPSHGEIQKLKAKHGQRLGLIEGELEGEKFAFVCTPADRKVLGAAGKMGQGNPLEGIKVLLDNTVVWGDAKLLEDTRVFTAVAEKVEAFNAPAQATLKNL